MSAFAQFLKSGEANLDERVSTRLAILSLTLLSLALRLPFLGSKPLWNDEAFGVLLGRQTLSETSVVDQW